MKFSILSFLFLVLGNSTFAQVSIPDAFTDKRQRCDHVLRYIATTPNCATLELEVCPPGSGMDAVTCAIAIGNIKCDHNRNITLYKCREECAETGDIHKCN